MSCGSNRQVAAVTAPESVPRPVMRQTWRRLTFLHWRYAPDRIRPFIPSGLGLDTFDNSAWIGLVPFEIFGVPAIPYFPETNVRTYVIGPGGSRAVWFFSLDAARLLAVVGARTAYHLPYFWASMRVAAEHGIVRYISRRHSPHDRRAMTDISVQPGELYKPSEITKLDHFLTARFRLYSVSRGKLFHAPIEHPPWPLARATLIELRETLIEQAGLPAPEGDPLIHYAPEISVKIGRLTRSEGLH